MNESALTLTYMFIGATALVVIAAVIIAVIDSLRSRAKRLRKNI